MRSREEFEIQYKKRCSLTKRILDAIQSKQSPELDRDDLRMIYKLLVNPPTHCAIHGLAFNRTSYGDTWCCSCEQIRSRKSGM